ncbi:MAG: Tex family protein [Bacillota bacterium]|nr:Tex family protein [Bacillota bacterium]
MNIIKQICNELNLKENQVKNAVKLIDEGNTIPFIARYRKEQTGSLDDVELRDLNERLSYLRNLEERKEEVIRLIDEQDKLTDELREEINKAEVLQRVEDLYRPYKQKRKTRATKAKAKGLEPLAEIILSEEIESGNINDIGEAYVDEEMEVLSVEEALDGAKDIIAEIISDNPDFRKEIREIYYNEGNLICEATDSDKQSVYEMYYKFEEKVNKIANHRILAINRGEKEEFIKVNLSVPDEKIISILSNHSITNEKAITTQYYREAIEDGYKRLINPSIEREIRSMLTERAEDEAIKVFAKNTKNLLLAPPIKDASVLAIDPSFRTGCKLTALDGSGNLLDYTTIYPNEPRNEIKKSRKLVIEWIEKYSINIIAIGNGTAARETEHFVAESLNEVERKVAYTIVSEAGASVYSASKIANEEFPKIDVSIRGAISIGRRLQDPLAELVKIDPKSIGVGQYQHDVNQKKLGEALDGVVEDCVNSVGVDLNTASQPLLEHISGLTKSTAKNIVKYRDKNGKFTNREQLMEVSRLGEKAFEQAAGFLRIYHGDNPLDKTGVHPETYENTLKLLEKLNYSLKELEKEKLDNIKVKILEIEIDEPKVDLATSGKSFKSLQDLKKLNLNTRNKSSEEKYKERIEFLSEELDIGVPTLEDIVKELRKPGRDPREDMPAPIFRNDILKIDDLQQGMMLKGTVRNVVDFGAFVDIGLKQDGLVHISEMSDKFIKNPLDVVQVGDTVNVTILSIDKERERISLSMKKKGKTK